MAYNTGAKVGPYEIAAQLGAGGMGEVYRARDPRLGRDIALKVIRRILLEQQHATHDSDALDRFLREATLASALNHPNIVTIYETGTVESDRYIAMELVEGRTLRKAAADGLPLERVVALARQVAEALAVAHGAQIVHRDIKPDNVMVRPDGYVKLLDFGLARLHRPAVATASTGPGTDPAVIVGTVAYMAPEQARGEVAAPEADIFSFGVMLYELLTGRHPFASASQLGTLHALMWEAPEPPSLLQPDLPRPIDQLVLEMLAKDPRLRPGAGEVLYRLGMSYDASVATALSSVTVSRDAAALRAVVGRDLEMDALLQEFERTDRGTGRLVVVSAEAGLGKTTLVDAFLRMLTDSGDPVRIGRGRCSERLAGSDAYLPVLEALESLQHHAQLGSVARLIRALAPSWYVQIMPPTENGSSAVRLAAETASGSQERLKREILALLEEVSRLQPVVLCFDDVHWADPSTTELLGYLARRLDSMRVMIIVTCRPSDLAQARHPFLPLKLDLVAHGLCREITPGRLDEAAISRYLALQFEEHAFPAGFAGMIHHRTEGHPLFVADLLRDLRRRQVLKQVDGRWISTATDLAAFERELPESVRSLVQRKMDALDEEDRRLLGAASVQGLDFDADIVATALRRPEEEVEDRLERLEREHALVRFGDEWEAPDRHLTLRYRFAHSVYQNAFYDALRATRRISLARSIAERMVERNGDTPVEGAAGLALLFETSRDNIRAADYWNRAAQAAARLFAHDETVRLARRGLALLESEPESPQKAAAELGLQMTYGLSLKTSRGYAVPEVGVAYARARALCRQVGDAARVIPVLIGMSAHHIVAGEIETSRDVALEMLDVFNRIGDPNLQMIGQWSLGTALFHLGELEVSHEHLRKGLEAYDPSYHQPRVWETGMEPGIFCRCEFSRTLMLLGFPDQGLAMVREAVSQARALENPQTLAFALLFQILAYGARRQPKEVLRTYDELSALCHKHGIAQEQQWAVPLRGRARVELGDIEGGLPEVALGLEAHTITRSALLRPYYFVLYAGALLRARRFETAQAALDEARTIADATHQHAYDSEHRRLQGELYLAQENQPACERAYKESLAIARQQGARWLELRAARGYARFLLSTGRASAAREILRPVCEWFTEGRETLDYVYAEALLRTLDGQPDRPDW